MNALSLFANVGLAETYLGKMGVNVVVANELIEERARFYSHLYPECDMVIGDITKPKVFNLVIRKAKENNVDFILATPPCQGMSQAGHNDPHDERNSLIKYAVDAVLDVRPKYVFFENVPQQLTTPIKYEGVEIKIPEYIERRLTPYYRLNEERIANAMDYGVPQMRSRAIFLMVRNDIKFHWTFPRKLPIVTLEQAFAGIPDIWPKIRDKKGMSCLPDNTTEALSFHKWHQPTSHVWRNVECMLHTPTGKTAFDNPRYYPKKSNGERVQGYETTYSRMSWDKPAQSITMWNGLIGSQKNVHPGRFWKYDEDGSPLYTNPRVLTIYELLIVSSLPLNWNIPSWASNQLIRWVIGEGVPPLMVKKIVQQVVNFERR